MKLAIGIPVCGRLERTKGQWGCLLESMLYGEREETPLLVVDNSSTEEYAAWLVRHVAAKYPGVFHLHRNLANAGVPASLNRLAKMARDAGADAVCLLHNDLFVYERGWLGRVARLFGDDPHAGVIGFAGARSCAANGGREGFMSALLEAESHGERIYGGHRRCAVLDGLALCCRLSMLREVGGFDEGYPPHHFYDKDVCLAAHERGWVNWVLPVNCHHESGITASSPEYLDWVADVMGTGPADGDGKAHREAEARFLSKWRHRLPLTF